MARVARLDYQRLTGSFSIAPAVVAGVAFAAALAVLFLRLPEALLRAEFWADDGYLFTQALDRGAAVLLEPYAGYAITGQQAVVLIETMMPPPLAPLLGNLVAMAAMAMVTTYIAIGPMPWSRPTGVLMAAVVLLLPANRELISTLSHVQWSLALWLAVVPLAAEPLTRAGRTAETAALLVAGLTGPFALLFGPLYLFTSRRRLFVIGACAAVQLVVWTLAERRPAVGVDLELLPFVAVLRGLVTPVLGPLVSRQLSEVMTIAVGLVIAASLGVAVLRLNRRLALHLAYVALVPLALGLVNNSWPFVEYLDPWIAARYFWFAGVVIGWIMVLTWPRKPLRSPAHVVLVILLVTGATIHARHHPRPDTSWAVLSQCIGGSVACDVPVEPGERWNVRYEP